MTTVGTDTRRAFCVNVIRQLLLIARVCVNDPDVGITAGASCPNNLIEDAIRRLFELKGVSVQELLAN